MASIIPNFPYEQLLKKGPALLHVLESWYFSFASYAAGVNRGVATIPLSQWVPGEKPAPDSGCLATWVTDTATIILSFDGGLSLVLRGFDLHFGNNAKLSIEKPFYLDPNDASAQGVAIVTEYNKALQAMWPKLQATIAKMTRQQPPRRVLCNGFCMGGGLAVSMAPFAALLWPRADVSCITFGAPNIGNPAFARLSTLLVGLCYRAVYRLDPVPDMPRPHNVLSVKLSGAGDELYFDGKSSVQTHRPITLSHKITDHNAAGYAEGISAAVTRPGPEVPTTAEGQAVLVDPEVAKEVSPELAADCACKKDKIEANEPNEVVLGVLNASESLPRGQTKLRQSCWSLGKGSTAGWTKYPKQVLKPPLSMLKCGWRVAIRFVNGAETLAGCLAEPVVGDKASAAVKIEQFWAQMREQAEAMRQSNSEVMLFLKDITQHGTSPEDLSDKPTPIPTSEIEAARAVWSEAPLQAGKPTLGLAVQGSELEDNEVVVQVTPSSTAAAAAEGAGSSAAAGETDRIKSVVAGRLVLPAKCASAAYHNSTERFSARTNIKLVSLVQDIRTGATAYVGWIPEESTAVLSFRGTASASDALSDLKFLPRQIEFLPELFPKATAHLGFLTYFSGLVSAVDPHRNIAHALSSLTGPEQQPTRVICCGHSMGGALATLGAAWAALQYPAADIRCVTFGSPRVGNRNFVAALRTLVGIRIRVVLGTDPIPSVPPAFWYSHSQPVVFLVQNKLVWNLQLAGLGWQRVVNPPMWQINHSMQKYLASLRELEDFSGFFGKEDEEVASGGVEGMEKAGTVVGG